MLKDPKTIERIENQRREVIARIESEIKERMKDFPPCHDWSHIERIRRLGKHIALIEGADLHIVDLALLLHDVADHKFKERVSMTSVQVAREIMRRHHINSSMIELHVCDIVGGMSFRNRGVFGPMPTPEGKAAQDADMLEAMGAIGIARVFTTGAYKKQPFYVPGEKPRTPAGVLISAHGPSSTIVHFYEKLLVLKSRMNTNEGKRLAKHRHAFLSKFLHRFHKEWDLEM